MSTTSSPPPDPADLARELLQILDERRQIGSIVGRSTAFDLDAAYRVTREVRALREGRGERVVGRKVGFTNTTIWAEYGVFAPIWGYVYSTTLRDLADGGAFSLSRLVEPRIEPEIILGLGRAPESGMGERALMSCVEWVAHGFEIVQSVFPGWRFTAADTVAAFGLHGALLLGPKVAVDPGRAGQWIEDLARAEVTLRRNGDVVDVGRAGNVLGGGPLAALRYLVEVLAEDPANPALQPGELVSTGTLTRAFPVAPGERWSTALSGLPVAGVTVSLA